MINFQCWQHFENWLKIELDTLVQLNIFNFEMTSANKNPILAERKKEIQFQLPLWHLKKTIFYQSSLILQHILVPLILFVVITSASKMFLQIWTKNNKYIPEIGFRAIFSKLKLKTWRRFYFLSSFDPEGGRKQFPSTCVGLKGCWAEQFSVLIGQKLRAAAPFWTAFTESRPEESWDPSSVLH